MNKLIKKGFTLVELLVVVAIIAVLASIVFANFRNARKSARISVIKSDIQSLVASYESYLSLYPAGLSGTAAQLTQPAGSTAVTGGCDLNGAATKTKDVTSWNEMSKCMDQDRSIVPPSGSNVTYQAILSSQSYEFCAIPTPDLTNGDLDKSWINKNGQSYQHTGTDCPAL